MWAPGEMAYAADLKSAFRKKVVGSSPTGPIEENKMARYIGHDLNTQGFQEILLNTNDFDYNILKPIKDDEGNEIYFKNNLAYLRMGKLISDIYVFKLFIWNNLQPAILRKDVEFVWTIRDASDVYVDSSGNYHRSWDKGKFYNDGQEYSFKIRFAPPGSTSEKDYLNFWKR